MIKNILDNDIFASKANVLKFLKNEVKNSKIEKIVDFTISDWQNNKSFVLFNIMKNFSPSKVIVRSSAIGEDSIEKSEAGNYESIQNVISASRLGLKKAINRVIRSYTKKGNYNLKNQILIQKQTTRIITSGVVFTRSPDIGSPYYIINYEDGNTTDRITKGVSSNIIKLFKGTHPSKIPNKWKLLINSIKEIEKILNADYLDVEFGITKKDIVIFQVRPITSIKQRSENQIEPKVSKLIKKNKIKFKKLKKNNHLLGKQVIFSDMSDWNPAEIIGNNPNPLDYSIYDYLIMKDAWRIGRSVLGYHNIKNSTLMVKFGNKPYVDVRASFNSLLPKGFSEKLKIKLINFYLKKLSSNSHLHDKVEFDILFTCYEVSINNRFKELKKFGFSKKDLKEIKIGLIQFTNKILGDYSKIAKKCQKLSEQMTKNRNKIKSDLDESSNHTTLLDSTEKLLSNCRKFGAIPFVTMARIAFIGSILLRSLEKNEYVTSEFVNDFMSSISTPLSEIQDDLNNYQKNKISKNDFLKKYGHLRPGTYDITAVRYDQNNKFFEKIISLKHKKNLKINFEEDDFIQVLKNHGLNFTKIKFLDFVKDSLIEREQLKFKFTKNLSDALELIVEAGKKLGFTREDLSYLNINTILQYKNKKKNEIRTTWLKEIQKNKKQKIINNYLIMPPLIFSEDDFEIINYYVSKPNYITNKIVISNTINIKSFGKNYPDIENKIILIENADPGFDWIFAKNPVGLMTKYGGVASHMAIRCAELSLPAAIGCGEVLFEQLTNSNKVLLDCQNEQILILEYSKIDKYIEEKKILKSLGYIK